MLGFGRRYFRKDEEDHVQKAQEILGGGFYEMSGQLLNAIDTIIVNGDHLARRSPSGATFASFGEFAVAPPPLGLGVDNGNTFRLLDLALRDLGHWGPLTEVVEQCVRERGRPSQNIAEDENFAFLRVPTSYGSLLRILITLKRQHPNLFGRVCASELTPREAARQAGFLPSDNRASGVVNISAAALLGPRAQQDLLVELWDAVAIDAQCGFIARRIEPRLGPELARRWRELGPQQHEK